jgi:hypothetical protein
MQQKAHKKKNPRKRSPKNKKNVFAGLRQLFLPLLLLLLISLSLAATFYIIFLHTPPKSLP